MIPPLTRQNLILLAAGGSAALLMAAFLFQSLGWAPCQMCLWQRWPHAAAVGVGVVGYFLPQRWIAALGALAATATGGLGLYHTGVERDWWEGPASCTSSGSGLGDLSAEALLPGAGDLPDLVLCDSFAPFLFGLSMANWNVIASAVLAGVWIMAARTAKG